MGKDVSDVVGAAIGRVAREAAHSVADNARKASKGSNVPTGVAAGVGLATLAPLAFKGVSKVAKGIGGNGGGVLAKAGEKVGGGVKDAVGSPADMAKNAIPGMGGGDKSKGVEGVGKGRRMPIQQDIDIGAPIKTVYEYWTNYEEWPKFMHRLDQVSQEDDEHVSFKTKIWGISKQFKAKVVEEREGERIKWKVDEGVTHAGVVTFHELGPRLTRVEVNIDVQPGSLLEKAARGMRHIKRAVRADLARFKAYVLMDDEGKAPSGSSSSSQSRQSSSRSRGSSSGGSSSSRSRGSSSRSGSSSSRSRASSGGRSGSSGGGSRSTSGSSRSSSGGSRSTSGSSRSSGASSRSSSSGSRSSNGSSRSSNGRSRSSSSRTSASSSNGSSSNGRSSSRSGSKRSSRAGSRS